MNGDDEAEAAAQGKPYKPLRRRRRRSAFGLSGDPYASAAGRERVAAGEPEELPLPDGFDELTDEEVAAAARAFWFDELCDRRDAEHDEGFASFVSYE